ncbi:MAG: hypothetical protein AAB600_00345 [Patescibacteria group bacterium]|mgnify:CR=1 FL=1
MYSIDRLFLNIVDNYKFLRADYVSITFNIIGIMHVIVNFLLAISLILIFYLIGKKIRLLIIKENFGNLEHFINIALGYILVGTGIAILGALSLLHARILFTYIVILVIIALHPLSKLKDTLKDLFDVINKSNVYFNRDKWIYIGIFVFILISFLRLIPPEIGEDAVGYHTDLPLIYLKSHTMMLDSKEIQRVLPIPQLGEMVYVITQFLGVKDASRYVHFMFYVLVVMLLCYIGSNKKTNFLGMYAPVLFVSAPVIIRHASIANVDFQALFLWLLSVFLIVSEKKYTMRSVMLSGFFFGGGLSTKLWEVAFSPIFFLYFFFTKKHKLYYFKLGMVFLFFAFLVSCIWYIRAYIITGNPVFPAFSYVSDDKAIDKITLFNYIGINRLLFSYSNLVVFSPLFFLGIIFLLCRISYVIKRLKRSGVFLFFILLSIEHLFIYYYLPRYLLNLYSVSMLIVSSGIHQFIVYSKMGKYIFCIVFLTLFFYYFLNTLFILPYGFGWADKNKYLTRIFAKDSSSYYDFDGLFDKHLSKKDLVAVYRLAGFYYANFEYIDIGYIFDKNHRSFDLLRKKGVTKLIVFGGDTEWFCKQLKLTGCDPSKYSLLASYLPGLRYLYSINEK